MEIPHPVLKPTNELSQGDAVLADLEVEVRPAGPPGLADPPDGLHLPDRVLLVRDDDRSRSMGYALASG